MRTATRSLAALVAIALIALVATVSPTRGEELLLVGVVLDGEEIGTLEVLREDGVFWLPLLAVADFLSLGVAEESAGAMRIDTPLGSAVVPPEEQRQLSGEPFVSQLWLERRLSLAVVFDGEEYAIRLEPPWRSNDRMAVGKSQELRPDIEAPGWGLSTWRQDLLFLADGDRRRWNSSTLLTGRAADGSWRARYEDDFDGAPRMREYGWLRIEGKSLLLAGQQTVSLHPLLDAMELTGVQAAWTNQPLDLFARSLRPGELLPRAVQPTSTFAGPAPPGAIAELRVDGIVVQRQMVSLQGRYEFFDVALPSRHISRVEVRIFDRDNQSVPIAIHEQRLRTSELLLPAGALIHMGGIGQEGNLVDRSLRGTTDGADSSGFYQFRYGLSGDFTLEAAVQRLRGQDVLQAGLVSRLARSFVLDLGLASSDAGFGYNVELAGRSGPWDVLARLYERSEPDSAVGIVDHFAEIEYTKSARLRASLVARMRRDASGESRFALPALTWRPDNRFTLRARPDLDGEYRLDASYLLSPTTRLALFHENRTGADLTLSLAPRYRLSVRGEGGGDATTAFVARVSRLASSAKAPTWSAGVVVNDGREGVILAADVPVSGGLLARFEAQTVPTSSRAGDSLEPRLLFSLTADLGFVGRRPVSADTFGVTGRRGAIAGRLRLHDGGRLGAGAAGLPVLVDGRARGTTEGDGTFFVGGLEEGVYRLEIDSENLPIDLNLEERARLVEVASGAVSRVEITARREYGIAGRLVDGSARDVADVRIELLDRDGRTVDATQSDRFGLYRFDAVPAGRFRVRAVAGDASAPTVLGERSVVVRDDFLFGQDLHLPSP
jgi:hypothetical protein